ncbi:MAG: lysoplasmalogenase [Acutalibacteraceae bacterium]|nr:lysoplasmalogenase [Acutalibacteraceae bacterium]
MKRNSSKIVLAINTVGIALLLVLNYFYQSNNFDYTLKCVCSSIFTGLGIINLGYALTTKQSNKRFYIGMTIAIIFSMLGDIFIYHSFVAGAGAFAISHICFIITYCFIQKIKKLDLIIGCVLFIPVALFLLFCPLLNFEEAIFKPVCVIYALIIATMFGKAVGNFLRKKNLLNTTLAVASLLFFLSDFILVFHLFSDVISWAENACMAMYFPSLCIFAFSMYLKINESNKICK